MAIFPRGRSQWSIVRLLDVYNRLYNITVRDPPVYLRKLINHKRESGSKFTLLKLLLLFIKLLDLFYLISELQLNEVALYKFA